MNAAIVCVDYSDYLAITLPYNRHHFEDVLIVTAPHDTATVSLCIEQDVAFHITNSFYDDGAAFNKWKGLEEALTECDWRHGWLALMDADILWPKDVKTTTKHDHLYLGKLYAPRRRMLCDVLKLPHLLDQEYAWKSLPYHRYNGWSGYTQIFHCDDPVLQKRCPGCSHKPIHISEINVGGDTSWNRCGVCLGRGTVPDTPWHQQSWTHAGGADSFFSELWPIENRVRPDWEVLHLGECGQNWCGRTTPMLDGSQPPDVEERKQRLAELAATRAANRGKGDGVFDPARYKGEHVEGI